MKRCTKCGETKSLDKFHRVHTSTDGRTAQCGACRTAGQTARYRSNRREHLDRQRARRYGVTEAHIAELLTAQNARCAICGGETPGGNGTWHVDHDHGTGKVRGLLCSHCNLGIGHLRDDPEVLRAAAVYLERSRA